MAELFCTASAKSPYRRVNNLWFALVALTLGFAMLASASPLPLSQLTSSRDLDASNYFGAPAIDMRHRMKRSGISDMRLAELEALIQLAKANREPGIIGKRMDWRMREIQPLWAPKDEAASFL